MKRIGFWIRVGVVSLSSSAVAVGCSRKQEPRTAPSSAPSGEAPEEAQPEAPAAEQEQQSRPPPTAPATEPAGAADLDEEEGLEDGSGESTSPTESGRSPVKAKRRVSGDRVTVAGAEALLRQRLSDLESALSTSRRDCVGAGRHRQAICDIAEQICGMLDDEAHRADTRDPERTCRDARSKCASARAKYEKECR